MFVIVQQEQSFLIYSYTLRLLLSILLFCLAASELFQSNQSQDGGGGIRDAKSLFNITDGHLHPAASVLYRIHHLIGYNSSSQHKSLYIASMLLLIYTTFWL